MGVQRKGLDRTHHGDEGDASRRLAVPCTERALPGSAPGHATFTSMPCPALRRAVPCIARCPAPIITEGGAARACVSRISTVHRAPEPHQHARHRTMAHEVVSSPCPFPLLDGAGPTPKPVGARRMGGHDHPMRGGGFRALDGPPKDRAGPGDAFHRTGLDAMQRGAKQRRPPSHPPNRTRPHALLSRDDIDADHSHREDVSRPLPEGDEAPDPASRGSTVSAPRHSAEPDPAPRRT